MTAGPENFYKKAGSYQVGPEGGQFFAWEENAEKAIYTRLFTLPMGDNLPTRFGKVPK